MTVARTTQEVIETLSNVTPVARATQQVIETLSNVTAKARVTQAVIEVVSAGVGVSAGQTAHQLIIAT